MPPRNSRLLLLTLALTLSSVGVHADDCSTFTKHSVKQQDDNLFNLCGYRGSQWTSSAKNLLRECSVMSKRDRAKRLAMRDELLASCSAITENSTEVTSTGRNRQQRLLTVLLEAIRRQDENLVRSVLKAGVNVGVQPIWMDSSPLFVAVELGNYHLARILLRAGAKPYLLAPGEVNPISVVLESGPTNYAFLEFLLQNKANPNVAGKDVDAERPIVLAAAKADYRSVNLLLKYKADSNLYKEAPAIIKAVEHDHFPIVRALINSGVNPNLGLDGEVCSGKLALDVAYRSSSERIIDLLLANRGLTEFECKRAATNQNG